MRGVKISDERIIAALQQAKGLITVAARALKCDPATIHARIKDSVVVAAAVKDAREEILDEAENSLHEAVKAKEAWAVSFTLRTIGRDRGYIERQEHKHSGQLELDHRLPDAERVARIVALLAAARTRRAAAAPEPAAVLDAAARPAKRRV